MENNNKWEGMISEILEYRQVPNRVLSIKLGCLIFLFEMQCDLIHFQHLSIQHQHKSIGYSSML